MPPMPRSGGGMLTTPKLLGSMGRFPGPTGIGSRSCTATQMPTPRADTAKKAITPMVMILTPPPPDGLPLDPAVAERETRTQTATFEDEPYDLVAAMPNYSWPVVVVSGGRDLITPPAVAERVAALVPDSLLLSLPTMAHSAVDFREPAALAIAGAVCRGEIDTLVGQGSALDALPARPAMRLLWKAVEVAAIAEGALPAVTPLWRRLRSA